MRNVNRTRDCKPGLYSNVCNIKNPARQPISPLPASHQDGGPRPSQGLPDFPSRPGSRYNNGFRVRLDFLMEFE